MSRVIDLNDPLGFDSPRGTLRVSAKQESLFPLGPVIKCLMILGWWWLRPLKPVCS